MLWFRFHFNTFDISGFSWQFKILVCHFSLFFQFQILSPSRFTLLALIWTWIVSWTDTFKKWSDAQHNKRPRRASASPLRLLNTSAVSPNHESQYGDANTTPRSLVGQGIFVSLWLLVPVSGKVRGSGSCWSAEGFRDLAALSANQGRRWLGFKDITWSI